MGNDRQARWIRFLGSVVGFLALWGVLRLTQPAPNPVAEMVKYRLVDPASRVVVDEWTFQGGRSTLILRDGQSSARLILEADQQLGGRIRAQDGDGRWHHHPAPPSAQRACSANQRRSTGSSAGFKATSLSNSHRADSRLPVRR